MEIVGTQQQLNKEKMDPKLKLKPVELIDIGIDKLTKIPTPILNNNTISTYTVENGVPIDTFVINFNAFYSNQTLITTISSDYEINLNFDNTVLSVAETDFTNSFCALFIQNKIDNINGNLNVQCGRPNGMSGNNIFVAKIKFNKLQADWAKINLNGSQILLNDDFGTNILDTTNIYNILMAK
jgi:hypothetical protein